MALFGRGKSDDPLVLMQQGQFKEAVKLLQAKLRRAPHDFSLKMRLAEALEGAGKREEASRLYLDEGEAALQEGDRAKGLALLKRAAKLFPDDAALKEKVNHLEGGSNQDGDDSFSFEVDLGGEEAPAGEPETPPRVPTAAGSQEPALEFEVDHPPVAEGQEVPEAACEELESGFEMAGTAAVAEAAASDAGTRETQSCEPLQLEAFEAQGGVEEAVPAAGELEEVGAAEAGEGEVGFEEPEFSETAQRATLAMEDHLPVIRALFPELSEEEAVLLDLVALPTHLEAGDVLVREQEEGDSLFIVARGRMEARGRFESGVVNLAVLSAGDLVGEVAFLKKVPRTATVTAVEPSLVLELPAAEVRSRLEGHPEALASLERILQERVERTLALLKERIRKDHGD